MKLKNLFEVIGIRRKAKHYGYEDHECSLGAGESVTYARWSHPHETPKTIDPGFVDAYRGIGTDPD